MELVAQTPILGLRPVGLIDRPPHPNPLDRGYGVLLFLNTNVTSRRPKGGVFATSTCQEAQRRLRHHSGLDSPAAAMLYIWVINREVS